MKSPFPGMDPYLEDSEFWRGFHNLLISEISRQLNANLPRGYAANLEEHVIIEPEHRIYPDIYIAERFPQASVARTGSIAILDAPETAAPVEIYSSEPNQGFIKVVTGKNWREVVAIIEVLSPANKTRGVSHDDYIHKQKAILCSDTHLLEIDLLRAGYHTVAAPYDSESLARNGPYLLSLSRAERRVPVYAWPVSMRSVLPRIALPLKPGDPDFALDLQAAFESAYEAGPYARSIDYAQSPDIPLTGADAAWAEAMLREKGLRGASSASGAARE